jgi:hypothetical protein
MKRENSVGSKVIWRMYHQFLRKPIERPIDNLDLPEAIICDIDGTLALHNRDPFDFDKLESDVVNPIVARIIQSINFCSGAKILLVTGRENKYVSSTQNWLNKNGIKYDLLLMRATDDTQRDDIVKQEIYEQHIKNRYRILFVLDDRDRVVAFWRSLGVVCLQVADGSF